MRCLWVMGSALKRLLYSTSDVSAAHPRAAPPAACSGHFTTYSLAHTTNCVAHVLAGYSYPNELRQHAPCSTCRMWKLASTRAVDPWLRVVLHDVYLAEGMHDAVGGVAEQDEEPAAEAVKEFLRRVGLCGGHHKAPDSLNQATSQHKRHSNDVHLAKNLVHLLKSLHAEGCLSDNIHQDSIASTRRMWRQRL